jgi:hypothetical protein
MATNNYGLGFLFSAKDDGVEKKQGALAKGFEVMRQSLARLSDGFSHIVTSEGVLTTGFEAQLVANNKVTSAMAANYGKVGDAITSFTQEAQDRQLRLNISIDAAARATREYAVVQKELGAIGIQSADDFAKFNAVTGVSFEQMRTSLTVMSKGLNFANSDIKKVYSSMYEMGKQTGDVAGALNSIPAVLEQLKQKAALQGTVLDPKALAGLGAQYASVSAGLYKFSGNAEDARSSALNIMNALVASQTTMQNAFAGTATDISELGKRLSIATGDVTESFKLINSGPEGFMKGMTQMVANVKKNGGNVDELFNLMRGQMDTVFGTKAASEMVNFWNRADAETLKGMANVSNASMNLGKTVNQGFRDGRTLADRFQLAQDMFVKKIREGSDESKRFVAESQKAFKDWGDKLLELSKGSGPMGMFARKMIDIQSFGAKALLPTALQPMAAVLGTLLQTFGPVLVALKLMGLSFGTLLSPITLVVVALGAIAYRIADLMSQGKSFGEAFGQTFDEVIGLFKQLPHWLDIAGEKLGGWLKDIIPILLTGFGMLLEKVPDVLQWAVGLVKSAIRLIGKVIEGLWDGIGNFLEKRFPEFAAAIHDFFEGFKKPFVWLGEQIQWIMDLLGKFLGWAGQLFTMAGKFYNLKSDINSPITATPTVTGNSTPASTPAPVVTPAKAKAPAAAESNSISDVINQPKWGDELHSTIKDQGSTMIELLRSINEKMSKNGQPGPFGPRNPASPTQNFTGAANRVPPGR